MKTALTKTLLMVSLFTGSFYQNYSFAQVTETNPVDTVHIYGVNPESCKLNLSLFIELYRQKNLNGAYLPWSYVFRECPKSSKNIYLHGVSILWNKINKTDDYTIKAKYSDTLMFMYDMQIKYFGENGKVLGLKGLDFNKLYPKKKTEALEILNKSIQTEGNKSDLTVLTTTFQISSELVKINSITDEQFLESYEKLSNIISAQIGEKQDSTIRIQLQVAQQNMDKTLSLSGKATCEKIIPVFTKKFESNRNNISNLKTISNFLEKQNCTDSKLYKDITEQLHKSDPSVKKQ
jgi:hypothetical protein